MQLKTRRILGVHYVIEIALRKILKRKITTTTHSKIRATCWCLFKKMGTLSIRVCRFYKCSICIRNSLNSFQQEQN